ncbi:hypothetical protein M514_08154 [Trichuris suis]|uniref:Uncharacterized protein n=1 Tax=Trichuris suis TaxID=68888 RepID=A0A085M176_9BILA|nr:hypothetical protein M513_08154 [Trichuris suis]KFD71901.1 hypothetical protein M514_08154 [Trichuris suis]
MVHPLVLLARCRGKLKLHYNLLLDTVTAEAENGYAWHVTCGQRVLAQRLSDVTRSRTTAEGMALGLSSDLAGFVDQE